MLKIAAAIILLTSALYAGQDLPHRSDLSVYRPADQTWMLHSTDGNATQPAIRWGREGDVLVPADYDGDGMIDAAVWRPSNGGWYIRRSTDNGFIFRSWGITTSHPTGPLPDVPVAADYDGDGKADLAVFRPDTGDWYVLYSSNDYNYTKSTRDRWGILGDVPVQSDYDGDGRADIAIFRPVENNWYIFESGTGRVRIVNLGTTGVDKLVPGDYTGDGKSDPAVYSNGVWKIMSSEPGGGLEPFQFGFPDDIAVPGDYDGDKIIDYAVFRNGEWLVYQSAQPRLMSYRFGQTSDVPVSSIQARDSIVAVP